MRKLVLMFMLLFSMKVYSQTDVFIASLPNITTFDSTYIFITESPTTTYKLSWLNFRNGIWSTPNTWTKRNQFTGAFRLVGRDTAKQDYIYAKTVNGVRHLYWRRNDITAISLDSATVGKADTSLAYTWSGLHTFKKKPTFEDDSLKINGLWYVYPLTRTSNSILYDSLGNGSLKWKTFVSADSTKFATRYYTNLTYKQKSDTTAQTGYATRYYANATFDKILTFSSPFLRSTNTISLRYSALNLRVLNDTLNTIQNMATSSAPTFAGFTAINGSSNMQSIYPLLTDTYDLGSWTKYWSNGYISQLQATIFAENTISAIGGYIYITKGQGILPTIASGTTQIDFRQTMTVGDFVLVKAKDASGAYKTEYMAVGTLVSGTTYNVTRDVASAHVTDPAWSDGTVYVILGNNGNGRLELNAYDTPRLSIIKQGATYNAQTEYIRLGDLNGFLGYSSETYGIAIGEATKYLKYDPTNGLVIAGNVTATTGAIGGWSLGATTLTGTNSLLSSSGYISFGATPPTSYGNNVGAWLGYSSGAKFSLYTDANRYFQYNGTDFNLVGGTITGGTIQTATSGQRVVINSTDQLKFYATGDYLCGSIYGYVDPLGHSNIYMSSDWVQTSGTFAASTINSAGQLSSGAGLFIANSSGQITKINNTVTAKYVPISNGTHYEPRYLAMSDLPALTANRVLLSDASGYVSASSISNTTLGYLDPTSSIQTQLNGRVATSVTVNGHALSSNVTVTATDVGLGSVQNFAPTYGELYAGSSSTLTTDGSTYVKWTGSTVGEYSGVTGNTTNDNLTIDTGNGGKYKVEWSVTFKGDAADDYYWTVNTAGSIDSKSKKMQSVSGANVYYSVSGSAIISLAQTNTVDLGCLATNGRTVTVLMANVNITKISN